MPWAWRPPGCQCATVVCISPGPATGTACWVGSPEAQPPDVGRHVFRSTATIDRRGRVALDRRSRAWLAVTNPASFEAVTLPLGWDCLGLLVVPVEDYRRRIEAVIP